MADGIAVDPLAHSSLTHVETLTPPGDAAPHENPGPIANSAMPSEHPELVRLLYYQ